jgi:hypothetical protein
MFLKGTVPRELLLAAVFFHASTHLGLFMHGPQSLFEYGWKNGIFIKIFIYNTDYAVYRPRPSTKTEFPRGRGPRGNGFRVAEGPAEMVSAWFIDPAVFIIKKIVKY